MLREMFINASPSGPDAVGVAWVDEKDTFQIWKKAMSPENFCKHRRDVLVRASLGKRGLGHVRWRTHGANIDENAHPFRYKNVTFIHNGIISNYESIANSFGLNRIEVDSECLGPLIEEQDLTRTIGSCGVVWFDRRHFVIDPGTSPLTTHDLLSEEEYNAALVKYPGSNFVAVKDQLFAYKRRQSLGAVTVESPINGKPLTMVVTSPRICSLSQFQFQTEEEIQQRVIFHPFEEGVCYHVSQNTVRPVWNDHAQEALRPRVYHGQIWRSGAAIDQEEEDQENLEEI
jgi:predicted glutamine amidotransferase